MNGPDPKEFELRFFLDNGFQRRQCPKCGRHFWTPGRLGDLRRASLRGVHLHRQLADATRPSACTRCARSTSRFFESERAQARQAISDRGALARRRVLHPGIDLRFPALGAERGHRAAGNPLTISQTCVRFNDIDNVGKTGRHFTFFEMCAHHAFNKKGKEIYFKDRTVELCHQLLHRAPGRGPEAHALHRGVVGGRRQRRALRRGHHRRRGGRHPGLHDVPGRARGHASPWT